VSANPYRIAGVASTSELPAATLAAIAFLSTAVVVAGFAIASPACRHWFVLPLFVCGAILALDVIPWVRGEMDSLNPRGLVALLATHVFVLSPLLQASQDFWLEDFTFYQQGPEDWRPWVGVLLAVNALGLILYRNASKWIVRWLRPRVRPRLTIDGQRLLQVLLFLMLLSTVVQTGVYWWFGTLGDYREAMRWGTPGLGRLLVIAESFPQLASVAFVVWAARRKKKTSIGLLGLFLIALPAVSLYFGGLRGSRSSIVWVVFLAVCLLHFYVRAITRTTVVFGLAALVLFMYGYGFFKWGGFAGIRAALEPEARAAWVEKTNKSLLRTLVFDLGRTNVQAALLYRLNGNSEYELALGRTYLSAAALVIPPSLRTDQPQNKTLKGTELLCGIESLGRPSRQPGGFRVTWIFGLMGEAILNFGPPAIPAVYLIFGLVVGGIRALATALAPEEGLRLLLPLLLAFGFLTLVMDLDNLIVFLARYGAMPALAILITSRFAVRDPLTARPTASVNRGDPDVWATLGALTDLKRHPI
jgi:hypothetical protein